MGTLFSRSRSLERSFSPPSFWSLPHSGCIALIFLSADRRLGSQFRSMCHLPFGGGTRVLNLILSDRQSPPDFCLLLPLRLCGSPSSPPFFSGAPVWAPLSLPAWLPVMFASSLVSAGVGQSDKERLGRQGEPGEPDAETRRGGPREGQDSQRAEGGR